MARLPTLVSQINERHDVLSQEYKSLGQEPSNDPANEMLGLVTEFTKIIHDYAYGNPRKEAFMQDVNAQYLVYKNKIWATAPRFAPVCSADKPEVDVDGKPIVGQKFRGIVDIIDLKEGNADHAGKVDTVMKLDQVRAHVKRSVSPFGDVECDGGADMQLPHARIAQQRPILGQGPAHPPLHQVLEVFGGCSAG